MRFLIYIFLLVSFVCNSQDIQVIQINAEWNQKNTLKLNLKNCKYKYIDIENLNEKLKKTIVSLPAILVLKNGINKGQFMGGIDMKLNIKENELQRFIDSL